MMTTAQLVREWSSPAVAEPAGGEDVYAHHACTWIAKTEEDALQAARNWCWEKIGAVDGSYIRAVPQTNNQDGVWFSRARVSVRVQPQDYSFGTLPERIHIIG